jgi:hypothetical protein
MRSSKVKPKKIPLKRPAIKSTDLDSSMFRWFNEEGFLLNRLDCNDVGIEIEGPSVEIREANKSLIKKDKQYPEINYEGLFEFIENKRRIFSLPEERNYQDVAYYLPFHLSSSEMEGFKKNKHWGVFIKLRSFLDYYETLLQNKSLLWIDQDFLAHIVLFKIFNEQYFHHLIESTATTLEILLATLGRKRQVYKDYFLITFNENRNNINSVATSYAMRSFKFVNNADHVYKNEVIKILRRKFNGDSSKYTTDLNKLLLQLLRVDYYPDASIPLEFITKQVMPRGHSAFKNKKEIPTWLVGNAHDLNDFIQLIPNPSETILRLFWARDTADIDKEVLNRLG